ncbi:hypothetical protein EMEDMD4_470060 [Sinorhizobium medicae]|uniref:Uncharacterized protein n=1 Tax=Sinorhizobium medicae TaxID=110321 RepID=A0A508WZP2_9HYPH|nr:hypothetical protein EMEDMD4_470060 [Sinorhizobium medicae]
MNRISRQDQRQGRDHGHRSEQKKEPLMHRRRPFAHELSAQDGRSRDSAALANCALVSVFSQDYCRSAGISGQSSRGALPRKVSPGSQSRCYIDDITAYPQAALEASAFALTLPLRVNRRVSV